MTTEIQEEDRRQSRQVQKRNSTSHITVETLIAQKEEEIFKVVREKDQIAYKGMSTRIMADFSIEIGKQ